MLARSRMNCQWFNFYYDPFIFNGCIIWTFWHAESLKISGFLFKAPDLKPSKTTPNVCKAIS